MYFCLGYSQNKITHKIELLHNNKKEKKKRKKGRRKKKERKKKDDLTILGS